MTREELWALVNAQRVAFGAEPVLTAEALADFLANIDALSRAALAPAPVTAEDFLPRPTSSCSGSALGGPTDPLCDDADTEEPTPSVSATDAGRTPLRGSEQQASPACAAPAASSLPSGGGRPVLDRDAA
jgi:hypothetical protein